MRGIINRKIVCAAFALVLGSHSTAGTQLPSDAPGAPVPAQITSAKKVFVSNGGEDSTVLDLFGHNADYAYNQLYAAMKNWKRLEVVGAPAQADVIVEIRFSVALTGGQVFKGDTIGPVYDPRLELKIMDPGTKTTLWGFIRHVPVARLKSNREKDSEQAVAKLIDDAKNVMSLAASASTATNK